MEKVRTIEVTSASPLSEKLIEKIEAAFSKKHLGEKLEFVYTIDKSIIGGILVIDGDKYYDGTVRSQVDKLDLNYVLSEKLVESAMTPKGRRRSKNKTATKRTSVRETADATAEDIKNHVDAELTESVEQYKKSYDVRNAGSVVFCGDGVIKINGLADAEYGEMLQIENGAKAIALSLEDGAVGAIVLDAEDKVSAHMLVKSTGMIVSVPVGESLLGRVLDPLGAPIDGLGELHVEKFRPIEAAVPAIKDRGKVNMPMETGILAIDSMVPIGRGQRELIIGDRQTGKTSIAVDTIIAQRGKGVICVYVAIGQKSSNVSSVVDTLTKHGAMKYTVVISATAATSAPLQYIAPYAGCAIAEEFMYSGKDVLIVYDDLSKHAVAYRAMSLLLKRPPGREAYPGDIFYLHSRLLERSAKLSDELRGGSMTALPIVETLAGDISAYIPTNIISITDGQIYLESSLFNSGVRPAINVGLSVSRVGSSAQSTAMRRVSGKLRLDLSQYRELAVFAQFGAELDSSTARLLEQGKRTNEMLIQDLHYPIKTSHQAILLYATTKELLNNIPIEKITRFRDEFIRYFDVNQADIVRALDDGGEITMDMGIKIEEAIEEFTLYFMRADHE